MGPNTVAWRESDLVAWQEGRFAANDVLVITWSSISGQTYRVQYNTVLGTTNWTDLPPDILATDVTSSQTDTNLTDPQRFYRVLVVP